MRDINAFLNSLVNIDRDSLVAILSSEVAAARQVVNSARQRTACTARQAARGRTACRSDRADLVMLTDAATTPPGMSRHDIERCKSVEQKLIARVNAAPRL